MPCAAAYRFCLRDFVILEISLSFSSPDTYVCPSMDTNAPDDLEKRTRKIKDTIRFSPGTVLVCIVFFSADDAVFA